MAKLQKCSTQDHTLQLFNYYKESHRIVLGGDNRLSVKLLSVVKTIKNCRQENVNLRVLFHSERRHIYSLHTLTKTKVGMKV